MSLIHLLTAEGSESLLISNLRHQGPYVPALSVEQSIEPPQRSGAAISCARSGTADQVEPRRDELTLSSTGAGWPQAR